MDLPPVNTEPAGRVAERPAADPDENSDAESVSRTSSTYEPDPVVVFPVMDRSRPASSDVHEHDDGGRGKAPADAGFVAETYNSLADRVQDILSDWEVVEAPRARVHERRIEYPMRGGVTGEMGVADVTIFDNLELDLVIPREEVLRTLNGINELCMREGPRHHVPIFLGSAVLILLGGVGIITGVAGAVWLRWKKFKAMRQLRRFLDSENVREPYFMRRIVWRLTDKGVILDFSDVDPAALAALPPVVPPAVLEAARASELEERERARRALVEFGFSDEARNDEVLEANNGILSAALAQLLAEAGGAPVSPRREPDSPPSPPASLPCGPSGVSATQDPNEIEMSGFEAIAAALHGAVGSAIGEATEDQLRRLSDMGYRDRDFNLQLLRKFHGNTDAVVAELVRVSGA